MTRSRLELAWNLLRSEGPRSLSRRLADHLAERRRRARFTPRAAPLAADDSVRVVTLLGTSPAPWIGGVQTQLLARLEGLETLGEPYALLYPTDRECFRLEVWRPEQASVFTLSAPALPARPVLEDPGFADVILRALEATGASALHVEHLGSLPIVATLSVRATGLPLLVSAHDFHLFCPRPHLFAQPEGRFCDYSRNLDRCADCLRASWPVDRSFQAQRRSQASELLGAATASIFPSPFLRDRFLDLFPDLEGRSTAVIDPGVPPSPLRHGRRPADGTSLSRPLHVAFAGTVAGHKGAHEIEELIRNVQDRTRPGEFRWTVFGGGDPATLKRLRRVGEICVWGYYRRGSLPELLRRREVDIVILPSMVPEAFGLALSEARQAGVPVLTFDHGALADRIRESGGGELLPLQQGISGFGSYLLHFSSDRGRLRKRAAEQLTSSPTTGKQNALAMLRLYSSTTAPSPKQLHL